MHEAHQHPNLMILSTKKHGEHLDVSLVRAWTQPSHRNIRSKMAKASEQLVVAFSTEGSDGQQFVGSDDLRDAHLGVTIGFSQWLSKNRSRTA